MKYVMVCNKLSCASAGLGSSAIPAGGGIGRVGTPTGKDLAFKKHQGLIQEGLVGFCPTALPPCPHLARCAREGGMAQGGCCSVQPWHREGICPPTQTLARVAQRGHGVSICGDIQNPTGPSPHKTAVDDADDLKRCLPTSTIL